jgi:oligoendopeptidase F
MASLRPETKDRSAVADRFKWQLGDIYPTWEEWEKDLDIVEGLTNEIAALKGTLANGPAALIKAFEISDQLGTIFVKIGGYSHLQFDLDQRDNEVNARQQRVRIMASKLSSALSWFSPEMLTIPWETMDEWLKSSPFLNERRFTVTKLYTRQAHVLDEKGEMLLSYSRRLSQSPSTSFEMLSTADVKWPQFKLSTGQEKTLSPAVFSELLVTQRSQDDRRNAFLTHFQIYEANLNTYAAIYDGVCQRDLFYTQARDYTDTLSAALDDDAIPPDLYYHLISITRKGVAPLQRYNRLRQKALGLKTYDLYDGFIPLVDFKKRYPFDSVKEIVIDSVKPLGSDYQANMERAFSNGWIDVYETDGKRSGAYSAGVYGVHPYILLNYNDTMDHLFTVAHEMGHSLHTLYSHKNQPLHNSEYTIFVAEVASTLNEGLLLEHMLNIVSDPLERAALLEHSINQIVNTFYSQVRFADYEREAHRLAEQGKPITASILNDLYYSQLKEYYGDSAELNDLYRINWARIPHFYRTPYYVYQYATSFAASSSLLKKIIPNQGSKGSGSESIPAAVERYIALLSSGGNDYPIAQLAKAGVDMTKPDPIQAVVETLDRLVTMLEETLS